MLKTIEKFANHDSFDAAYTNNTAILQKALTQNNNLGRVKLLTRDAFWGYLLLSNYLFEILATVSYPQWEYATSKAYEFSIRD